MTEVGGAVAIVLFRRDGELLEMSLQKNVHSEKIPFGCHVGHHPHTCPCWDPVPPWKWTLKGLRKEDVDVAQIHVAQRSKRSGNRNNGVDSCDANGPV